MNTKFFFFLFLFTDTVIVSEVIKIEKKHKPGTAIIFSAVLPGAGQGYNKQYWKIPLFYSALGTTAFTFDYFNKQYQKFLGGLINFQEHENDSTVQILDYFKDSDETTIVQWKDKYRRNRDLSALVFLAVYALNIIDATVYAHLADFDVSDDLSFTIQPEIIPLYTYKKRNTIGLSISLRF